jgi:hypothetical protein
MTGTIPLARDMLGATAVAPPAVALICLVSEIVTAVAPVSSLRSG